MKNFTLLITTILLGLATMAQTPQAINYQAIARNLDGDPVINQEISVKISILAESASGTVVYSERHEVSTNSMGLFSLGIGNPAEVLSGVFSEIAWGSSDYFLKVEMDETGGSNYQLMGISQLLSVPYALWSEYTAHPEDADADPLNELQTVTKVGQTVTLSDGGGSFIDEVDDADTNPSNEIQTLTQNGNEVILSQGGGTINVADDDSDPANELQVLTKNGSTVSLSQNGGNFTDEVDDADADPANEFQNLNHNKNGNLVDLSISNGTGTTIDVSDADANPVNELQTLSQNGNEVTLSAGGGVVSVADDDSDPVNELQTLAEQGYEVTLSQGGGMFLAGIKSYTQAEIDAMTPYNGLTVHNATTNCINYYFVNAWFEMCGDCTPLPSQANAGDDQLDVTGTSTTLQGNTPEFGNGLWSILSGGSGNLADATDPTTLFNGLPGVAYTLQWKIYTPCDTTYDTVNISFMAQQQIAIGDEFQGGIVAYILQPGDPGYVDGEVNGFIAAASNQSTSAQWGCWGTWIPGADGTDLGSGYQNTLDIVAGCSTSGIAARICDDLELNGYDDWYLPSKEEMNKLYLSKDIIGGFGYGGYYWSSSEDNSSWAWGLNIGTGNWSSYGKSSLDYVRAVRSFSFTPFTCGDTFTDTRDGQTYTTVQIGEQCWMAENLNIGTMIYGSSNQADNDTIEKYCYNNSTYNCDTYRGLYQWNEMMQYTTTEGTQGICMEGWHLPTDAEWTVLTDYLGGVSVAGGKMKETGTTHWYTPNVGATNSSGFTGLPGGYRYTNGQFFDYHSNGFWWSSTENSPTYAWCIRLSYGDGQVYRLSRNMGDGNSVRCLRD